MASSSLPVTLSVHMLSSLCETEQLRGSVAVVADILRASTTMTTALRNGADCVVPCLTIEDALNIRRQGATGQVLLGGERGGVRIDGFEFGNSPADYSSDNVRGRTVGFTTTNGTRTLLHAAEANQIVVGSFVNLSAIVSHIRSAGLPVHVLCAGTDGHITGEDVLFAGAVVDELLGGSTDDPGAAHDTGLKSGNWLPDDSAAIARSFWCQNVLNHPLSTDIGGGGKSEKFPSSISEAVERVLRDTRGGRNLRNLGYSADIALCSRIDSAPVVPVFCKKRRVLTLEQVSR